MENIIKDALLLKILKEIEKHTNHIRVEHLELKKPKSYKHAMFYDRDADEFILKFQHGHPPTQQIICHELLHVCHSLDGWPDIYFLYEYPDDPALEDAIWVLIDLVQHVSMWPMLERLGYSENAHWTKCTATLARRANNLSILRHIHLRSANPVLAILLAQALLSPAEEAVKKQLRSAARDNFSVAFQGSQSIVEMFESARPFSQKSCLDAFWQAYSILEGKTEDLQFSYMSAKKSGFCQHVLDMAAGLAE